MFDRTTFLGVLARALGGAIAIAIIGLLHSRRIPPLGDPFCHVNCHSSPTAKPAQPRALIGGHLISTIVGLVMLKIFGPNPWAAAVAVGLSMMAMHLSSTFHPSAGIDPLVVVMNDMSWRFLFVPVGTGAVLLALFALIWHKLVAFGPNKPDKWPVRWW